jgi:hypothetical protein
LRYIQSQFEQEDPLRKAIIPLTVLALLVIPVAVAMGGPSPTSGPNKIVPVTPVYVYLGLGDRCFVQTACHAVGFEFNPEVIGTVVTALAKAAMKGLVLVIQLLV